MSGLCVNQCSECFGVCFYNFLPTFDPSTQKAKSLAYAVTAVLSGCMILSGSLKIALGINDCIKSRFQVSTEKGCFNSSGDIAKLSDKGLYRILDGAKDLLIGSLFLAYVINNSQSKLRDYYWNHCEDICLKYSLMKV